jgi:hypothetical protein
MKKKLPRALAVALLVAASSASRGDPTTAGGRGDPGSQAPEPAARAEPGQVVCGGEGVDLATDPANCGACRNACKGDSSVWRANAWRPRRPP